MSKRIRRKRISREDLSGVARARISGVGHRTSGFHKPEGTRTSQTHFCEVLSILYFVVHLTRHKLSLLYTLKDIIQQLNAVSLILVDWSSSVSRLPIFSRMALGRFSVHVSVCVGITPLICVHHIKFHFLIRNGYYSRVNDIVIRHGECYFQDYFQFST